MNKERKEELDLEHWEGQQDHDLCFCGNRIKRYEEGEDDEFCEDCR